MYQYYKYTKKTSPLYWFHCRKVKIKPITEAQERIYFAFNEYKYFLEMVKM